MVCMEVYERELCCAVLCAIEIESNVCLDCSKNTFRRRST